MSIQYPVHKDFREVFINHISEFRSALIAEWSQLDSMGLIDQDLNHPLLAAMYAAFGTSKVASRFARWCNLISIRLRVWQMISGADIYPEVEGKRNPGRTRQRRISGFVDIGIE